MFTTKGVPVYVIPLDKAKCTYRAEGKGRQCGKPVTHVLAGRKNGGLPGRVACEEHALALAHSRADRPTVVVL